MRKELDLFRFSSNVDSEPSDPKRGKTEPDDGNGDEEDELFRILKDLEDLESDPPTEEEIDGIYGDIFGIEEE